MILLLGGTIDGRKLARSIQDRGWPVTVSVVSTYAADLLHDDGIHDVETGPVSTEGLVQLLREKNIKTLVDATHPYAAHISAIALQAANCLQIEHIRLERKQVALPDDPLIHVLEDLDQLKDQLQPGQRVFSTLGSKQLPLLARLVQEAGAELFARVLPSSDALCTCEKLGLGPDQIIALKGPFSREMNRCLLEHCRADLLITKESGTEGGFEAKLQAGLEMKIPVFIWGRPHIDYPILFYEPDEVIAYIDKGSAG